MDWISFRELMANLMIPRIHLNGGLELQEMQLWTRFGPI